MSQKNFWEKNVPFPELDPCFEMGVVFYFGIFGKICYLSKKEIL
jgi:hypothetical protein